MPFNPFWVPVTIGTVLLLAPQLLLRSMNGHPMFGTGDDSHIMRMGRVCGFVLMIIFGGFLLATRSQGAQ